LAAAIPVTPAAATPTAIALIDLAALATLATLATLSTTSRLLVLWGLTLGAGRTLNRCAAVSIRGPLVSWAA
jgi:hypothetical protein